MRGGSTQLGRIVAVGYSGRLSVGASHQPWLLETPTEITHLSAGNLDIPRLLISTRVGRCSLREMPAEADTGDCDCQLVNLAALSVPVDVTGGASGAAALVGVALCCPSAHSLRGWRDL